ncbi:MAG: OsmC family protein [Crocinitomicaceae bacterium]|nr:OsmC family protein [Crocinitomicaceae bacterium]
MKTSRVEYLGALQTKITHLKSGDSSITDAPVDNNGKGSRFSPTDLAATSLASCMITVIGIHCDQNEIQFTHADAYVKKIMGSNPRRIIEIQIELDLSGNNFPKEIHDRITRIAKTCPVANSLHPEINQVLNIKY